MKTFRTAAVLALAALAVWGMGPAAASASGPSGTTIFVSPTGSDSHSGRSPGAPLRTPQRAQQVVRSIDRDMHADITVALMPGTYRLRAPLSLDARDSGTNGHRVIWTAWRDDERPVLSGGVAIGGWHLSDPTRGIWAAPAPAGLRTRQLYVNGVRAQRASGPLPVTLTPTATGYTASAATMASWRNPSQIEFVYTGGEGYWSLGTGGLGAWTEPRCPVGSISGATITMAQPCWDNSTRRVSYPPGVNGGRTVNLVGPATLGHHEIPASVENAFELLSEPGQWYLDSTAGTVYYIPRPGENLRRADVEAPVLQTLVSGQGSAAAPLHDVSFRGIQFSYATYLQPSTPEGFSEIQAGFTLTGAGAWATQGLCQFIAGGTCPYGNWTKLPGNVSFGYDQRVHFEDDAFVHLGAAGLDLGDGSQDDTVAGSVFTDVSGNGLELGGVDMPLPSSPGQRTSGNQILDNHVYGLPVEYHGGVGIDVGYAERTTIAHNQIDHTAYTEISLGWGGWPDKIQQPATPNFSNRNTIADNLIFDGMQELADGGGIYTQGITGTSLADGERITGNVVEHQLDHGHALYTDNGSTFITITRNVELGNENDWGSRHTDFTPGSSGFDPLDIEGNWWQQGDNDSTTTNVIEKGNRIITSLSQVPEGVVRAAGLEPRYRGLLSERFGAAAAPIAPTQVTAFGVDGSAYVGWNPAFVGSPTSYTVTASPGGATATISAEDLQRLGYAVVRGLTNGTPYTFTVSARNGAGSSPASLPTATITPGPVTATAPGAPTSVSVRPGDGDASVHWDPPTSNGGSPILGYTISAPGAPTVTFTGHVANWAPSGTGIFTTVGHLRNFTPYTFQVAAFNAVGTGPATTVGPVITAPTRACNGATLTATPSTAAAKPGDTVQVDVALANGCTGRLQDARLYVFAPPEFTVSPSSPQRIGDVTPTASATRTFRVTIPAGTTKPAQITALAGFQSGGQQQAIRTSSTVMIE